MKVIVDLLALSVLIVNPFCISGEKGVRVKPAVADSTKIINGCFLHLPQLWFSHMRPEDV